MILTDLPFVFKRLQFLGRLVFAIIINKSQNQSLEVCRIKLRVFVFRAWAYAYVHARSGHAWAYACP